MKQHSPWPSHSSPSSPAAVLSLSELAARAAGVGVDVQTTSLSRLWLFSLCVSLFFLFISFPCFLFCSLSQQIPLSYSFFFCKRSDMMFIYRSNKANMNNNLLQLSEYNLCMCEGRKWLASCLLSLTSTSHKWLCFGCQDISHAHVTDRGLPRLCCKRLSSLPLTYTCTGVCAHRHIHISMLAGALFVSVGLILPSFCLQIGGQR